MNNKSIFVIYKHNSQFYECICGKKHCIANLNEICSNAALLKKFCKYDLNHIEEIDVEIISDADNYSRLSPIDNIHSEFYAVMKAKLESLEQKTIYYMLETYKHNFNLYMSRIPTDVLRIIIDYIMYS